jgi:hypothetical protein
MNYYRITWVFLYLDGRQGRISLTRSSPSADYQAALAQSRTIIRQNIRENNNNVVPAEFQESIESLTLSQFNAFVKGPDDIEVIESIEPQIGE